MLWKVWDLVKDNERNSTRFVGSFHHFLKEPPKLCPEEGGSWSKPQAEKLLKPLQFRFHCGRGQRSLESLLEACRYLEQLPNLGCPHFMKHELQNYSILFQEVIVFVTKRRPCAEDRETSWCEGGKRFKGCHGETQFLHPSGAWKAASDGMKSFHSNHVNQLYRGEHWSWEVCTSF